jgi:TatA/E family protein of Tat protein translocase
VPFDGALSPLHWLIIAVVAFLVIGPEQLPAVARRLGRGFAEVRKLERDIRAEVGDLVGSVSSGGDMGNMGNTDTPPEPPAESPPERPGDGTTSRGSRVWPPA